MYKRSIGLESLKISRRLSLLTIISTVLTVLNPCFTEAMGTRPKAPPPNLLLITIDTLRADHLGCYGYQDIHTPCIDTLASEGILFTQALTPVPITLPSHVSIMTGLYPMQHGICNNANSVLGEEATTLAEIMEKEGYKTAAFVGAFVLHSMFGLNQGFQVYNNSPSKKKRSGASPFDNERRAEEVTRSALQWLESNHDSPFFLWVHYFDPHAIYLPPSPFREEYKGRLYDGEIAYTDSCLGHLLDGLKKSGVSDNTVIILTADHGEGLGEHGESTHTVFLYDSTLHIPLILKIPPGVIPGRQDLKPKITSMVSLLDIFPTIMDLFSLRPDQVDLNQWPGKSLIPLIEGSCRIHQEEIFCETLYPELNFGWSRVEGIRTGDWKYVKSPRSELYHLSEDPNEMANLLPDQSELAQSWEKRLIRLKKSLEREKRQQQVITDNDVLQRLESLGYFRSVRKDPSTGDDISQRPDPKDMIHLIESMDRGLSYYYLESYDRACEEFHKILEVNPDNVSATFYLGSVEEKMGKFEQARDRFLQLLAMEPNYLDAHNHLGVIYHHLGQAEEAVKEFQIALKKAEYPDIYYDLGVVYKEMGLLDEATKAAQSALKLDHRCGDALNLFGEIALKRGKLEEARNYFDQVLQVEPDHLEAENNLGVVYYQESRYEEALAIFLKAASLDPNNAEVHNNVGSLYLAQESYAKAKEAFQKALSLKQNYLEAWVNLGSTYFKEGELGKARELYQNVLGLFPKDPEAWNYLGLTQFTQGDYQESIVSFKKALEFGPAREDLYLSLGKAYLNVRLFEESLHYFQKVIEMEPSHREAHVLMGHILFDELGRAQEALMEWGEAYRLDPDDPSTLMNMATVNFKRQRFQEAINFWEKALEIDPNLVEPVLHIGTAYLKQNRIDKAIQTWQGILKRNPSHPEALINLGTAFYQRGDIKKAIEAWQEAELLSQDNSKIHYNLALAYFNRSDYHRSVEELREVLRLEPGHTQARMLMEIAEQQGRH